MLCHRLAAATDRHRPADWMSGWLSQHTLPSIGTAHAHFKLVGLCAAVLAMMLVGPVADKVRSAPGWLLDDEPGHTNSTALHKASCTSAASVACSH